MYNHLLKYNKLEGILIFYIMRYYNELVSLMISSMKEDLKVRRSIRISYIVYLILTVISIMLWNTLSLIVIGTILTMITADVILLGKNWIKVQKTLYKLIFLGRA